MIGLRRFVIGTVNTLLFLFILLATLVGAVRGLAFSYVFSFFRDSNIPYEAYATIAFVFGGIVGFLLASIPAVVIFLLTEIAENTRQTMFTARAARTHEPTFDPA